MQQPLPKSFQACAQQSDVISGRPTLGEAAAAASAARAAVVTVRRRGVDGVSRLLLSVVVLRQFRFRA